MFFSFRCPLVLLAGYFRELANSGFTDAWLHEPFTIDFLKNTFGFEAPAILAVIASVIVAGMGLFTVLTIVFKDDLVNDHLLTEGV